MESARQKYSNTAESLGEVPLLQNPTYFGYPQNPTFFKYIGPCNKWSRLGLTIYFWVKMNNTLYPA
ncbi:MAG: hypothetical protein AAF519_03840 [Bacteroidota bacterium]